ncbi:MAG: methyltransferase domain-containing protein [Actinomycetota bacterium]
MAVIQANTTDQALSFGEDPALYDRFRPSYPRGLIEDILAETGDLPALEVGAGTGKATRALLALGKAVHAIEPDHRMAAVLEVSCPSDHLVIDRTTLEASHLPRSAFDLVLAAQSWHWVRTDVAYDVAADALDPEGVLALMWHHPHHQQGVFGVALGQLYRQIAPEAAHPLPGLKGAGYDPRLEPPSAMARFRAWSRAEHAWEWTLDAPSFIGWLCTGSETRKLGVEQRAELMAGVAALIGEFGGEVVIPMRTVAHLAHRA